ncbi:MAG: hypothetical protein ACOYN2_00280 [Patescibacteria group bacterium]
MKKFLSSRSRLEFILAAGIFLCVGAVSTAWAFGWIVLGTHAHTTPHKVHFHANFAVWIDKAFVDYSGNQYMEELASCAVDPNKETPQDRVHLHENKGGLIHVHDAGATWGHLMSNLRWNFGANYLVDATGKMYQTDAKNKLRFVLNGKLIPNPQNLEMRSEDRLLIDYSSASDAEVIARFA